MGKKGRRDKEAKRGMGHRKKSPKLWLVGIALGGSLLFGLVFFLGRSEPWGLPAIPRNPRPGTLSPLLFTGQVARAYRIAQEVPELLERMPCYCGCYVSPGHRNNLDCYTDRHSAGWKICVDITLDAYQMYKKGKKIEEIKKAIDAKYAKYWPYEKKWPLSWFFPRGFWRTEH